MSYYYITYDTDYLEHHGIKGQKRGIRRYQNEDGSLTTEGRIRYGFSDKTLQRGLNEQSFANEHNRAEAERYKRKAEKREMKGKDSTKYREAEKRYSDAAKKGDRTVKSMLDTAKKEGYLVKSRTTKAYIPTGAQRSAAIIGGVGFGPIGAIVGTAIASRNAMREMDVYSVRYGK